MDEDVTAYIDAIGPKQRPLFDRLHAIVLAEHPDAEVALSYGMPAYRVGARRLNLGVWQARCVRLRLATRSGRGFAARHPELSSGKATIRIRPRDAGGISDDELRALLGGALDA